MWKWILGALAALAAFLGAMFGLRKRPINDHAEEIHREKRRLEWEVEVRKREIEQEADLLREEEAEKATAEAKRLAESPDELTKKLVKKRTPRRIPHGKKPNGKR